MSDGKIYITISDKRESENIKGTTQQVPKKPKEKEEKKALKKKSARN